MAMAISVFLNVATLVIQGKENDIRCVGSWTDITSPRNVKWRVPIESQLAIQWISKPTPRVYIYVSLRPGKISLCSKEVKQGKDRQLSSGSTKYFTSIENVVIGTM
jgi:hypothetical protein